MSDISRDDVRRFLGEAMTYDDLQPSRYDELVRRSCRSPFMDAITKALDETFGANAADAHAKLDEIYELAEYLANELVDHDRYKQIRKRIKTREDF